LRRAYLDGLGDLPDWRITCFFADRRHRGRGVASAALAGALGGPQGPRASGGRCRLSPGYDDEPPGEMARARSEGGTRREK
jgi:hypothetical protein